MRITCPTSRSQRDVGCHSLPKDFKSPIAARQYPGGAFRLFAARTLLGIEAPWGAARCHAVQFNGVFTPSGRSPLGGQQIARGPDGGRTLFVIVYGQAKPPGVQSR
jgi:hypothetical protein